MIKCEYEGCENEAEFIDEMDSVCCESCMLRETEEYGRAPEDFETISAEYLHMREGT